MAQIGESRCETAKGHFKIHNFIQLWVGLLDRKEYLGKRGNDRMGRGWILQGDSRIRPLWSRIILDATNAQWLEKGL